MIECDTLKRLNDGKLMIEVDGVRILFKEEVTQGAIHVFILKSTNYNLICKIEYDTRKKRVLIISCNGFKSDKVKAKIEESLRKEGLFW
jgi:hypothetical protein